MNVHGSARVTEQILIALPCEGHLSQNSTPLLVFDVGGSHIAGGLFHADQTTVDSVHSLPVRESGSADEFFATFESLKTMILPTTPSSCGVAVAIPNPFDYERGISYMQHKYKDLYGKNVRGGLAHRLGCDPCRVHFLNDAAAFLLGELCHGAAAGARRAIGITLGTGVGSAFAVDGKIVTAGIGVPAGGEIWNVRYRNGVVEDFISTRSIQGKYEQLAGIRAQVREIASRDEALARQTFDGFGKELGRVLREVCLGFAPDRIVLGGGISHAAQVFLRIAEEELAAPEVQLWVSQLFEQAPLLGAGASWKDSGRTSAHALAE